MTRLTSRLLQDRDWALFDFLSDAEQLGLASESKEEQVLRIWGALWELHAGVFSRLTENRELNEVALQCSVYNRKEWSPSLCGKSCVCRTISQPLLGMSVATVACFPGTTAVGCRNYSCYSFDSFSLESVKCEVVFCLATYMQLQPGLNPSFLENGSFPPQVELTPQRSSWVPASVATL